MAGDVSPKAAYVARGNVERHQVQDRVEVIESDLFANLGNQRFEIVVSNPPYITEDEYAVLPRSVKNTNPSWLWWLPIRYGHHRSIASRTLGHLEEGGWLIFEISPMLATVVAQRIASNSQWTLEKIAKDLAGHPRVVVSEKALSNEW